MYYFFKKKEERILNEMSFTEEKQDKQNKNCHYNMGWQTFQVMYPIEVEVEVYSLTFSSRRMKTNGVFFLSWLSLSSNECNLIEIYTYLYGAVQ